MAKSEPCFLGLSVGGATAGLARLAPFHQIGHTGVLGALGRSLDFPGRTKGSPAPTPQSDEGLLGVVRHFQKTLNPSKVDAGILVTDVRSAGVLKKLHPDIIRACHTASSAISFTDFPVISPDGASLCFIAHGAVSHLLIAIRRPRGAVSGRMDVICVRNIADPDGVMNLMLGGRVQVTAARIRHEYGGEIPGEMKRLITDLPSDRSSRKRARLAARLQEIFWDEFSPSLRRPFIPERTNYCIFEMGKNDWVTIHPDPIDRTYHVSRGNLDKVLKAIETIAQIDPGARGTRLHYSDDDMTYIELRDEPLFASTFNLRPGITRALGAIIAWSGLTGTEVRGYAGDRKGEEVMGPAFIQIEHKDANQTGHETLERIAWAIDFLTSNGILSPEDAEAAVIPS